MPGTRGPTPGDTRAMLRLSHALHTSTDPVLRKKVFLAGISELLNAGSAMSVVAHVERVPRRHTIVSVARHGVPQVREEQLLGRCLPALDCAPAGAPSSEEPRWQHVIWPGRPTRSLRLSHCLRYSAVIYDAQVVACLSVVRRPGDSAAFAARDRMLLHLAHVEMSWIYETDLVLATHGAASLSPRQRQTLEYLLAGFSEKQIAGKMRLSPNTVHHHIKAIHRHFDVSSRSELLARWVR